MLTAKQIYELALKMGIKNDPRGEKEVKKILADNKKEYKKLDKEKKKYADECSLFNPYSDSRLLTDDSDKKVKKLLVGIDMDLGELLLADKLGADMVWAHHPEGRGLLDLDKVMHLQIDTLFAAGIAENIADKSMAKRMGEIKKGIHAINAYKNIQAAEALGLAYICTHTMADNITETFVKDVLKKKKCKTLGDIKKALLSIPEYEEGAKRGDGPEIYAGSEKSRAGKVHVFMTGGTSPGDDVYEKLSHAGVGTLVDMHMSKTALEKAEKHGLNVVCAGHIPSDSIGMNIIADEVEKKGVKVIAVGGMIRVRR